MNTLLTAVPPEVVEYGRMIGVAVAYSLVAYSSKWLKNGDTFLPRKFIRTVVVGAIVGAVAAETGAALSIGTVPQLASAVGAIHLSEVITGGLYGAFRTAIDAAEGEADSASGSEAVNDER